MNLGLTVANVRFATPSTNFPSMSSCEDKKDLYDAEHET